MTQNEINRVFARELRSKLQSLKFDAIAFQKGARRMFDEECSPRASLEYRFAREAFAEGFELSDLLTTIGEEP